MLDWAKCDGGGVRRDGHENRAIIREEVRLGVLDFEMTFSDAFCRTILNEVWISENRQ